MTKTALIDIKLSINTCTISVALVLIFPKIAKGQVDEEKTSE
jgi:hypothetical protein